jgi:general secretion pathway protein G
MLTRSKARRGFTLIEILIVLGIIMLLATAAIVALVPQQRGARIDTTKIKMKSIQTAIEAYNVNIGHYPSVEEGGLQALLIRPAFDNETIAAMWRGPYLTEQPRDSWANEFHYEVTQPGTPEADQTPYRLWSNGPDGMDGTDDDVKNWSETTGMP